MSSIYAVVDKTKKKDRSIPKKEIESDEADSGLPLYAVVDKKKDPKIALECPEDNSNSDIVTVYSKKVAPSIAIKNASCDGWREKKLIIAMILIVVVLLLCVMSICVALTEISKLRSEATMSSSSIQHLIMDLNESLYSDFNKLTQELNGNISFFQNEDYIELNQELNKNISSISGLLSQEFSAFNDTLSLFQDVLSATSCAGILFLNNSRASSSGYYWITSNGSAVRVYCNMTMACGNITGGWTRVASLNMSDNGTQCPSGLREKTIINDTIRACVNKKSSRSCSSDIFSTYNLRYSNVCGQIRAYQFGNTDAFLSHESNSINDIYVDGVSLTHGSPRRHIWTFAAALNERSSNPGSVCPCFINASKTAPPSFVGDRSYFCDTGYSDSHNLMYYGDDPLWDGDGCEGTNKCCYHNTPPWFYKSLVNATTDDIEMRVCRNEANNTEDIAIEMMEFYIQ